MPNQNLQSLMRFVAESPGTIAMFDRDLRYLAVSQRWSSDFNVRQDLVGLSHYEVFPEITDAWKAIHRRALAGETIRADREAFRRQDGTTQWLQWAVWPWLDGESQVGGVIMSSFDLTDQVAGDNAAPGIEAPAPAMTPTRPQRSAEQREIITQLRTANLFLNHLPKPLFDQLADHLFPVTVAADTVLVEPLQPVRRVYFPLDGLNTMFQHLEDGSVASVATGGRGGIVGLSVVTGEASEETETRALIAGTALAIEARALREVMAAFPEIHRLFMKFNAMLAAQMSVSFTCMARHSLDQRLARWLLIASQRMGDVDLAVRQESLAMILGVRRTGASEAMSRLVAAGIVETGRRRIVIRDHAGLEARSCECFREAEAARVRSAPEIVITPPIPSASLHELVDRFRGRATDRRCAAHDGRRS